MNGRLTHPLVSAPPNKIQSKSSLGQTSPFTHMKIFKYMFSPGYVSPLLRQVRLRSSSWLKIVIFFKKYMFINFHFLELLNSAKFKSGSVFLVSFFSSFFIFFGSIELNHFYTFRPSLILEFEVFYFFSILVAPKSNWSRFFSFLNYYVLDSFFKLQVRSSKFKNLKK